jgi:hypothetical protein
MNSISIIGACYGAYGEATKTFDVTSKVQKLITRSGDSLEVDNHMFNDPCPGHSKHFGAVYKVNGQTKAVACKEGQRVNFS